ncbi:hypothetical protein SB761_29160, partial [Pseudomonas sp. SIMBA_064]
LNKESFNAACDDIINLTELQDRLMALSMAFRIFTEHGESLSWLDQLKQATDSHSELRSQLEAFLNPPTLEVQEWEIKKAEWEEKSTQRKAE